MSNIISSTGMAFGASNGITTLQDANLGSGIRTMDAAGITTGMAFLEGELEKRDPKIREPLTSVTWQRDIVAKTGGGWVDFTSTMDVDYATSGANQNSLVGGQTDVIPMVQANVNKDIFKVFTWAQAMKIPFVDGQKMQTIGRSLDSILDRGIRLNYNKSIDQLVYGGFTNVGIQAWAASEYDDSAMANHILLPPTKYAYIASTRIGTSGDRSILDYLLENNIAKNQGKDLKIYPSRWCAGVGTGNKDRMVVYVNDDNFVYFDLPVPLTRAMTQPVALQFAYVTIYAAQMGQVKFLYTQPVRYVDGI